MYTISEGSGKVISGCEDMSSMLSGVSRRELDGECGILER
jgi:hypothetical protein